VEDWGKLLGDAAAVVVLTGAPLSLE